MWPLCTVTWYFMVISVWWCMVDVWSAWSTKWQGISMRSLLVADLEVDQHRLRPAASCQAEVWSWHTFRNLEHLEAQATNEKFTRRSNDATGPPFFTSCCHSNTPSALERWVSKSALTTEAAPCKSVLCPAWRAEYGEWNCHRPWQSPWCKLHSNGSSLNVFKGPIGLKIIKIFGLTGTLE